MNILLVGGGGREHAITVKLAESPRVSKIYCAPGNGGTASMKICENISQSSIYELVDFAVNNSIDMTIVGPEALLVEGIADAFVEAGLKIFAPNKKAAILEGSKAYSKGFMAKYGIPTAKYNTFNDSSSAVEYIKKENHYPIVIKADGLAAGKGVIIAESFNHAREAISSIMEDKVFGDSGSTIVVEEFLVGVEASILSFCDGETILPLLSAKDHKRALDGDKGENTGGMGAIAPNPYVTDDVMADFNQNILLPTLEGIKKEKLDFVGVIFFGLMITENGVYLIEYNTRMGDPETQVLLPMLKTDLTYVLDKIMLKELADVSLQWEEGYSACITLVSGGYPSEYKTGYTINGVDSLSTPHYIAGANLQDGKLKTSGGRVINVVGIASSLEDARKTAYENASKISFTDCFYRKDIGVL